MKSKRLRLLLLTLPLFILWLGLFASRSHSALPDLSKVRHWFALYDYDAGAGGGADIERMRRFDMAILDPDNHPVLALLRDKLILIAYLSVGEAEDYRAYWRDVASEPWVLHRNPDWDGNYYVDVRSPEWKAVLMDRVIPEIRSQGFQGLLLDTLDTAAFLEESFPGRYPGARLAMVDLVKSLHEKYPDLLLVSNNGFEILPDLSPYLSALLVEDIHSMVDFKSGGTRVVPPADRAFKLGVLEGIMRKHNLAVFSIDYVSSAHKGMVRKCIRASRRLGFKPYVAEKDLSTVYVHTLRA